MSEWGLSKGLTRELLSFSNLSDLIIFGKNTNNFDETLEDLVAQLKTRSQNSDCCKERGMYTEYRGRCVGYQGYMRKNNPASAI